MSDKGPRGEREAVVMLEKWWRRLEPEVEMVRTPKSGGWAHAAKFKARGDVMVDPGTERFPFSVEVKRREAWSPDHLLDGRPSPVWKWWLQCQAAARDEELEPLLLFRKNRRPWLAVLRLAFARVKRMPEPDVVWARDFELARGFEVGERPCLYLAERLVAVDPALVALNPPGSRQDAPGGRRRKGQGG